MTGYCPDGERFEWTRTNTLSDSPPPDEWISGLLDREPELREAEWIIGVPGPCGSETVERTPNLPGAWEGSPFVDTLRENSVDYRLENDAHLAALGLSRVPEAREADPFLGVTLGTGIGGGIIVDGQILRGHEGGAAEIGHLTLEPEGRPCSCGKKGCFEAYASARGLAETFRRETGTERTAREIAGMTSPAAEKTFRRTGRYLGRGLALVANVVAPERILIAGGLAQALDRLSETFRPAFERNVFVPSIRKIPVDAPDLTRNPTLLGAVVLSRSNTKP